MNREEAIKRLKEARTTIQPFRYVDEAIDYAIKALEQELCEDCISRKSLKHKLQEHHDFFLNAYAYGEFSNLPQNDKSRVDEITNCIAMVVNEPSVKPQPKMGWWIAYEVRLPDRTILNYRCSVCGRKLIGYNTETLSEAPFCHCGAKMVEPQAEKE